HASACHSASRPRPHAAASLAASWLSPPFPGPPPSPSALLIDPPAFRKLAQNALGRKSPSLQRRGPARCLRSRLSQTISASVISAIWQLPGLSQATSLPRVLVPTGRSRENNSCVEKKVLGEKTENPKKFKINYMGANEAMLLDTDYDNFLFLCLTDTTTRIQCLMCQYLARVLVEDDEIMKGFIRAFRPLHKRLWYLLDLRKTEEPCHF
uniref:Progestagen-associated endometrial protein n=1 Tax=Macaca mulatta TaxID=9544 RepID=A0A5F7ZQ88_MACMU